MSDSEPTIPIIPSISIDAIPSSSSNRSPSIPTSSSLTPSNEIENNKLPISPPVPPIQSVPLSRSAPTSKELEAILHSSNPRPRATQERQEVIDERCYSSCRQTNARRALGREPSCYSLCYINFRNHINALIPVPNHPGTFLAAMDSPSTSKITTTQKTSIDSEASVVPKYHWKGLDGRYLYYASGRDKVSEHLIEMAGENWKGIEALKTRCETARLDREDKAPKSRAERIQQLGIRRSLGMPDEER